MNWRNGIATLNIESIVVALKQTLLGVTTDPCCWGKHEVSTRSRLASHCRDGESDAFICSDSSISSISPPTPSIDVQQLMLMLLCFFPRRSTPLTHSSVGLILLARPAASRAVRYLYGWRRRLLEERVDRLRVLLHQLLRSSIIRIYLTFGAPNALLFVLLLPHREARDRKGGSTALNFLSFFLLLIRNVRPRGVRSSRPFSLMFQPQLVDERWLRREASRQSPRGATASRFPQDSFHAPHT